MYRDTAESYNLVLSYSRKGNCYDNACMENFYGHLKSETIYQLPITQRYCLRRKELKKIINDHITWYNNERIQAKLNYLSSVEFCLKNYRKTVAIQEQFIFLCTIFMTLDTLSSNTLFTFYGHYHITIFQSGLDNLTLKSFHDFQYCVKGCIEFFTRDFGTFSVSYCMTITQ